MRNAHNILISLKGRRHFRDLDTDGMLMLKWVLQKMGCEDVDKDLSG